MERMTIRFVLRSVILGVFLTIPAMVVESASPASVSVVSMDNGCPAASTNPRTGLAGWPTGRVIRRADGSVSEMEFTDGHDAWWVACD